MSVKNPECEANGCYMFAPNTPERVTCEQRCRLEHRVDQRLATGRFHRVDTGRFSFVTSEPNLQNIPIRTEEGSRIRDAFHPKTVEFLADIGRKHEGPQCTYTSGGVRCCREPHEDGPHLYKCASEDCPGYPWRASNTPHPCAP